MVKLNFDLNVPIDSSNIDEAAQNGGNPKSVTFEIHHSRCFTPTPSRSYVGGHVSSVNVVDIDEFCLYDLKDMVTKLGYGVADLMYYHFLRPRLGLDYGLHPLNVDVDVLEMARNLTPMCHRNLTKEWKQVSSKALSIGEVIKNLSKKQAASSMEGLIVVESVNPFEDLDEILEENSDSDSEDLDYDPKHDEVFDDDEHIVEDVHVSTNNFNFTPNPKHDLSMGVVEVQEHDLDVIDYDSFGSDLDDGIDSERRIQLKELKIICKQKNKVPNKYYFYLGQQFATKKIVIGRVRKHSVETMRKLILVKKMIKKG
ncbi:hypothetical protein Tco_0796346 [Tanacetum coccineum]